MHFVWLDANALIDLVVDDFVAACPPKVQADVRAAAEIALGDDIAVRAVKLEPGPDAVCFAEGDSGVADVVKDGAAAFAVFAPAKIGVVEVIGEIAVFDGPMIAVIDLKSCSEA